MSPFTCPDPITVVLENECHRVFHLLDSAMRIFRRADGACVEAQERAMSLAEECAALIELSRVRLARLDGVPAEERRAVEETFSCYTDELYRCFAELGARLGG